jgi:hypothetical protein
MQPTNGSREGSRDMAQKVITTLIDDLDGDEAVESLIFGLDGATYEIDLNAANADRLREIFQPYVDSARRTGNGAGRRTPKRNAAPRRTQRASSTRSSAAPAPVFRAPSAPPLGPEGRAAREVIRERARAAGEPVSDRGRLSQDVIARYGGQA